MTGFDYFKKAFNQYSDIKGRARRSEYWYFRLFSALFIMVPTIFGVLMSFVASPYIFAPLSLLGTVAALTLLVPGFCVLVRRLHDTGKSGTYILIALIPIIGAIVLLVFLCTEGDPGENKWGPNPKEVEPHFSNVSEHLV